MSKHLLLLISLSMSCAFAQEGAIDRYDTDTTVVFQEKVTRYYFDFDGAKQGFYWGNNENIKGSSAVRFYIKNSSQDTIRIAGFSKGNDVLKIKQFDSQSNLIFPNDSYMLVGAWESAEHHIEVPIIIDYIRSSDPSRRLELRIPTWQDSIRQYKLHIYQNGNKVTSWCQLSILKNGVYQPVELDNSKPSYPFFPITGLDEAVVQAKIRYEGKVTEAGIFTFRGTRGNCYYQIVKEPNSYPYCYYWKTRNPMKNLYAVMFQNGFSVPNNQHFLEVKKAIINIMEQWDVEYDAINRLVKTKSKKQAYLLDQKLRKSGLGAKLWPVFTIVDGRPHKILSDKVIVYFSSRLSNENIEFLFKELEINDYNQVALGEYELAAHGKAKKYIFRLPTVIGTLHTDILEEFTGMSAVKFLKQEVYEAPYLNPPPD